MAQCAFNISGLSDLANKRLLSISITDQTGLKSDKCSITLDDRDFKLATPPLGQTFTVALGYTGTGAIPLKQIGTYQLDEISFIQSPARTIKLSGNAQQHVDNNVKAPKTQSWDEKTLGAIFGTIAQRNGYVPNVHPSIAGIYYDHLDQTKKSDTAFVTEIAEKHDAYVKFQDGKMIVKPRSETEGIIIIQNLIKTQFAIGGSMEITVPTNVNYTTSKRTEYKSIKAHWQNIDKGERVTEVIGAGEPVFEMNDTFTTKAETKAAASAKLTQLNRGTGDITVTCPGDPNIRAGMRMVLVGGFRFDVLGQYIVNDVTHTMDSGGYKNSIKGERL
jgi:phage protein D